MITQSSQRRTLVFQSENGGVIGGSDYYMGRLIDSLDPARWRVGVLVRPGYPLSQVTRRADQIDVLELGRPLAAKSLSSLANPSGSVLPKELPPQPNWRSRLWSRFPRNWRRDVGLARDVSRIRRLLESYRAELFHTMDGGCQPAIVGAKQAGCAVVVGYCGPPRTQARSWYGRHLDAFAVRDASAHIVKSQFAAKAWGQQLGMAADRFEVIPNGIQLEQFRLDEAPAIRRKLGIPDSAVVVGMTARFNPEKGALVFGEALQRVARNCPQAWFVCTGDGPCLPDIVAAAKSVGAADRLCVLGHRRDVAAITTAYDIAVVPSVVPETFGWVLLEAMAAQRPVVASLIGAIPEVVRHNQEGLLVPPDDAESLAATIERLIVDPPLRHDLGKRGRERVEQRFTREVMLKKTHEVYARVSRKRAIAPPGRFSATADQERTASASKPLSRNI